MSTELFERLKAEIEKLDQTSSLTMTAVFMLPKSLTKVLSWIIRNKQVRLAELATYFETPEADVLPVVETLMAKGFLEQREQDGQTYYWVRLGGQKREAT